MITTYFLVAILAIVIVNLFITWRKGIHKSDDTLFEMKRIIETVFVYIKESEKNIKDEFVINRKEITESATGLRTEMGQHLNQFTQTFATQLNLLIQSNEKKLEAIRSTIEDKLTNFQIRIDANNRESRDELKNNLELFKQDLQSALKDYKDHLTDLFSTFEKTNCWSIKHMQKKWPN